MLTIQSEMQSLRETSKQPPISKPPPPHAQHTPALPIPSPKKKKKKSKIHTPTPHPPTQPQRPNSSHTQPALTNS